MTDAIVDTTILTDITLKTGETRNRSQEALNRYAKTYLPIYAIKEFRSGPLYNYIWMHNKLASTNSFAMALSALQGMSRTPKKNLTATAIQCLQEAAKDTLAKSAHEFSLSKGDSKESMDKIQCDEFRLNIKLRVQLAWRKRRKITTDVIAPLYCFNENGPTEKNGLLELQPHGCQSKFSCAIAHTMVKEPDALEKMRASIVGSDKEENKKRAKVLRQLYRTPKRPINRNQCRQLGDAVFSFLAPPNSVVLTTNLLDHQPLAQALGKDAETP